MQPAFHAIGAPCESGPSVRHESQSGPAVSDDGRRPDSGSAGGHPRGRRLFPLSIRASLIVVLLVPLLMAVGLASTVVVHQLSTRQQAVTARQSSLALDSLLRARVAIYAEYIPSQAIVTARSYHISSAALDSLLGADVQTNLVDSRRSVDHQAAFGSTGVFHTEYAQLVRLRRSIDQSTASPTDVATLFNGVGSKMEARWEQTFGQLSDTSASSDSPTTKSRLTALGLSFSAFSSGLAEENLPGGGSLETVLTVTATPAQVESLIVSRQQFEASTRSFPGSLGPNGAAAWESLNDDPLTNRFSGYFQTGIAVGLGHLAPPYAVSSSEIGEIARSLVAWASSLASLVLASSSDLRTASTDQAASATQAFVITVVLMLLLVLLAVGAALVLGRQVRRPLARIVAAATSVREGELEIPALDESGPKELALAAAAFNEMASTLRAVQAQAIVLSEGDLDDPVLKRQLPGRTGAALQMALNQLHRSAKASETERQTLLERATRDSLTGLLNRGLRSKPSSSTWPALAAAKASWSSPSSSSISTTSRQSMTRSGTKAGMPRFGRSLTRSRVTTRASDVIARFGGDEFVVGWLGNSDSDVPEHLAKRIGAHVARSEIGADGHSMALACSIGVAVSVPSDRTVEALIERADRALYEAKADGRGQIHWFGRIGPADSPVAAER